MTAFVYAITDGTDIKFGWALNVKRRMATLQTGNPRRLRVLAQQEVVSAWAAKAAEAMLHRRFREDRTTAGNEWFSTPEADAVALFCDPLAWDADWITHKELFSTGSFV